MATVNSNTGSASLTSTITVVHQYANYYDRSSNTATGSISLAASVPAGSTVTGCTLYWTYNGATTYGGAAYIDGTYVTTGSGSKALGAVSAAYVAVSYKSTASGREVLNPQSTVAQAVSFTGVYLAVTYNEAYTPPSGGSGTPPPPPGGSGTGTTACTPPTNIQINDSTVAPGGGAVISWTLGQPGVGNDIYSTAIWRSSSPNMTSPTEIRQQLTSQAQSWTVYAPSTAGQTYYYRLITVGVVVGYNSGFSSEYVALTAYVTPVTSPNAVTIGGANPLYTAGGSLSLAWSGQANGDNNNISGFNIYKNGSYLDSTTGTSYTISAPAAGSADTYKILALGPYGNATYFSPNAVVYTYSAPSVWNMTAAGASVNITVINGAPITLAWGAANGAYNPVESYTVQRSDNGGAWTNVATSLTSASFTTNAHANAGNNSRFRVIAIGQFSSSDYTYSPYVYTYPASTGSLDKTSVPMDGTSTITLLVTPGSSSYSHKAVWYTPSWATWEDHHQVIDIVGTIDTLTVPLSWCKAFPDAISGTCYVRLETYNGATKVGEVTYTFTVTVPASVVPSLTSVTAALVSNGVPAAITKYVQSHSKVTLTINGAVGVYNSTISSVAITGGGFSASASPSTFGPLPTAGTITFTGTVTDSRGRTASKTVAIVVQPYTKPSLLNISMFRSDDEGTEYSAGGYVRFYAKSVFSSIDGENEAALEGRVYMKGAAPSAYTGMTSETAWIGGGGTLLAYKSYVANIRITDLLYDYTFEVQIPTETVLLHGLDGVAGAAIGKYAEREDAFDIPDGWTTNILLKAYPIGAIYTSADSTSPATLFGGTWSALGGNVWERTA